MAKVLSVGQCGYDDSRIGRAVSDAGATLDRAFDAEEAKQRLSSGGYSLVLVNRIFDGDGSSGVEFIESLKKTGEKTPVMLVSDYADAQAMAVAEGAIPGFGKRDLGTADVIETLRSALEVEA
jgi:DNA-binding NtrC family response regulator